MEKITQRKMVTIAMLVSIFLVAIDTTIVTTAMPHIVQQLNGLKFFGTVFNSSLNTYAQRHAEMQNAMAQSMHLIFILIVAVSIANLMISLFLPPHSKIMAQQRSD